MRPEAWRDVQETRWKFGFVLTRRGISVHLGHSLWRARW